METRARIFILCNKIKCDTRAGEETKPSGPTRSFYRRDEEVVKEEEEDDAEKTTPTPTPSSCRLEGEGEETAMIINANDTANDATTGTTTTTKKK